MNQTKILLIFDIDGTLLETNGLTRIAFEQAVKELYGKDDSTRGIKPFGLTDQIIFRQILDRNQIVIKDFDREFRSFADRYISYLAEQLNHSEKSCPLPGITNLLAALSQLEHIYLSLGTGNIEESARLKLKRVGLDSYFPVGGFGSDSYYREAIIKAAWLKSRSYYQLDFKPPETWVIGDTPLDIQAGQNLPAKTLAVASGSFNEEQLQAYQPTAVLNSLNSIPAFLKIIDSTA